MEVQIIKNKICSIKGQNVMLDFDLADLYETNTKKELEKLRSQFVFSSSHGGTSYAPFAFTEQGVGMLASVITSTKAIQINIEIVRAFAFLWQYSLNHKELSDKLKLLERKFEKQFKDIYSALNYLIKQKERNH